MVRHPFVYKNSLDHQNCQPLGQLDFNLLESGEMTVKDYCMKCIFQTLFSFRPPSMTDRVLIWQLILNMT